MDGFCLDHYCWARPFFCLEHQTWHFICCRTRDCRDMNSKEGYQEFVLKGLDIGDPRKSHEWSPRTYSGRKNKIKVMPRTR